MCGLGAQEQKDAEHKGTGRGGVGTRVPAAKASFSNGKSPTHP